MTSAGTYSDGFVEAPAEILHEVAHQQRHVFRALAQCRNVNRKNIQAVVEVAAKVALGDQLWQIAIGRGHHADVDALRAIAAQAFEFLLLQHAQQFRLQLQRDVADFVQKQACRDRPIRIGRFSGSCAPVNAPRSCPKSSASSSPDGNRRAIDFHKGALATRAEIVNGARDDFLAGASLAQKQHGGAGGRNEFDLCQNAPDGRAFADDFLEIESAANLFFEIEFFFGRAFPSAHRFP